jgi:hypothetical protein
MGTTVTAVRTLCLASGALLASAPAAPPVPSARAQDASKSGVWIDAERGIVALRAAVLVKEDLLEYLLVAPHGATHESLFLTEIAPSVVNAALLAAGAEPGENARWEREPTTLGKDGEVARGEVRVFEPHGGTAASFLPYVAWREDGEDYFFRVEDLVTNLESGRSMRRHAWVYLGSRFAPAGRAGADEGDEFLADVEGNLVNISFFFEGNTLFTAALPACRSQTIWVGNRALLPEPGTPVVMLFSRERLTGLPDECRAALGGRGE